MKTEEKKAGKMKLSGQGTYADYIAQKYASEPRWIRTCLMAEHNKKRV